MYKQSYLNELRKLIRSKGLTQVELAERIGLSKVSLNKYLTGRTKLTVDLLLKFSEILDVPVSYFFGESNGVIINNGIGAGVNHGRIDIQVSEQQKEIERLRAELSGCRELVKAKEQMIEQLKEMIQVLREKC